MKKLICTLIIFIVMAVSLTLTGFALEEPSKIEMPEVQTPDRVNYYLPEISTVIDITASNADEPYSEVTVTNPATTTEPDTSSKETNKTNHVEDEETATNVVEQKEETTKESKKPPVELATSDKAVVAIAVIILVIIVISSMTLNKSKGKEEETL